jgi:hypothetical protein
MRRMRGTAPAKLAPVREAEGAEDLLARIAPSFSGSSGCYGRLRRVAPATDCRLHNGPLSGSGGDTRVRLIFRWLWSLHDPGYAFSHNQDPLRTYYRTEQGFWLVS